MSEPAPSIEPSEAVNPTRWRRRVWLAVAAVAGVWAVIYVAVVVAYVLGQPAEVREAPHAEGGPDPHGEQGH